MRMIVGRLCAAGLKVNPSKCSFGLKEIPYLGYVITRGGGGYKPRPEESTRDHISRETNHYNKSAITYRYVPVQ